MAIEATYAANEYMRGAVESSGLSFGELYPGTFAPSVEDGVKFATYSVVPSDTYDLPGLKKDFITYRFYNPDFDELHKILRVVKACFNVYDIEQTSLSEPDIIFQESFFRVISTGEASFAEGVDYYTLICELTLTYTENVYSSQSTTAFIEGT